MSVINDIASYAWLVLFTFGAMFVTGIIVAFYFLKVKKVSASEEIIDYDKFVRTDAREYCKFDDIYSGKSGMGIIHMGNNTYVAGIEVQGYNYAAASADEQQRTMINSIAFFNALEQPIQMCQSVKGIDISRNIEETKENAKEIEIKLLSTQEELAIAIDNLKKYKNDDDIYTSELVRAKKLTRTISSLEWQIKESKALVGYMERVSDTNFNTMRSNQIFFSYYYNPDGDIEVLSEEEITIKAENELKSQASIYSDMLEACGCTTKVLKADDLVNILRRELHPVTCDELSLDELLNSTYNSLYVTTDSFEELERERRGDLEFEELMNEYARQLEERREAAQDSFNNTVIEMEQEREKVV